MTAIPVRSPEHWHELRGRHVGSSEVAALFGEHPQLTAFELWHQKAGTLPRADLSDDERVFWGQCLEPAIAEGVRRKTGWNIRKVHRYHTLRPNLALGASLDFEITAHPKGWPGILEIKTADWLVAKRWGDDGPPLAYELQVQHALAACGRTWGVIAVLVGGNDLRLYRYEARQRTIEIIGARVAEFWDSVEARKPPAPDFMTDAETVAKLYRETTPDKVVDLSGHDRLRELIGEHVDAAARRREGEKAAKAARAEIHMAMGDAEIAFCGDWIVKASEVRGSPDRTITEDMIGGTIKGRDGYRGLRITERKQKERAA